MVDQDWNIMTFSDRVTHAGNTITPQSGGVLNPLWNKNDGILFRHFYLLVFIITAQG